MLWAALVAPGVVLNKDGSLLAGWSYQGPDLNSATAEELLALAQQANRVLLGLDESWILHCDVLRSKAPAQPDTDAFQHPVTQAIEKIRELGGGMRLRCSTVVAKGRVRIDASPTICTKRQRLHPPFKLLYQLTFPSKVLFRGCSTRSVPSRSSIAFITIAADSDRLSKSVRHSTSGFNGGSYGSVTPVK